MTVDTLPFLLLALALGVKHAFDADHLAATSVFVARAGSARGAARMGLSWGIGHTITAGVLTVALFLARDAFLSAWLEPLEFIVAATLIALGAASITFGAGRVHDHAHRHAGAEHAHAHLHLFDGKEHRALLGIGLLHGLASNDELLLFMTAGLGVASLGGLLLGVGAFSVGVVAGMALFGAVLALPVVRARSGAVRRGVVLAAGVASVATGVAMLLP